MGRVSSNVIGVLRGSEEPDRYVMVGNHRDAWGFGALDPGSGTAQMMQVVRVLGEKGRTGWRPKRSLVFLSWGAEELSLLWINTNQCIRSYFVDPIQHTQHFPL